MEVRNCRGCGRLYNYIGGEYKHLCQDCIDKIEKKFEEVKEYIEENKTASMAKISEDCDVSSKQIEQWVREERLVFSEDSMIGISCEICGATIKSGRFCENCKQSITDKFDAAFNNNLKGTNTITPKKSSAARMRFLDK